MRSRLRSLAAALFRRPRLESDMETELRFHIDKRTEDLLLSGIPQAEARRRAALEFGSLPRVQEECREARGLRWPDELRRDVRYALRILRKSPAFTLTAVATLALCIGANTAVFSVVDAVLLRPLPYPEPDRLASVAAFFFRAEGGEGRQEGHTGRTWEIVRDYATFLDAAAYGGWGGVNFAAGGRAEYIRQQRVAAGFFRVLGVNPVLGREFTREEDRPGGPAVAVLSHAFWRRAFHGDPSVIGRSITLRGEPYTVVGVMPEGFRSGGRPDVWTPLRPSTTGEGGGQNYSIVARLRQGIGWPQADSQMRTIGEAAIGEMQLPAGVTVQLGLAKFQQAASGHLRTPLLILWAAVGLVLLIGCTNIAGLLLARSAGRTRELATRMALGGGRRAVLRQLLTESLVLAMLGGLAGIAAGYAGVRLLRLVVQEHLGVWQPVTLDVRVLAATMGLAILTSLLFGLLPALQASRVDLRPALSESGGRGVAGGRSRWPRRLLVVGEVALGVILLVSAGLLIRTFETLRQLRPGFDPDGVLTANASLQDARYAAGASVARLFDQSLARIRDLPGVEAAAAGLSLPYERALNWPVRPLGSSSPQGITTLAYVTPDYFRALRIPVLRGRDFDERDAPNSMPVAVVNEEFARKLLGDRDPIGSHLEFGEIAGFGGRPHVIVGVVGDVQQTPSFGEYGPLGTVPAAYVPVSQVPDGFGQLVHTWFSPNWIVRASGRRPDLVAGMQRAVEAVDPLLPFAAFRTLDDVRSSVLTSRRIQATLLAVLAALALVLAAVGIYGLIANSVAERTRELGIRMALGAGLGQAMRAVALPGILLAAAGVALGCLMARAAVQALRHLIWGVSPGDPVTFIVVAAGLLLVAAAASLVPALRVARLNPAETLRVE